MKYKYECIFILGGYNNYAEETFEDMMRYVNTQAQVVEGEDLGLKKLAYRIQGNDKGHYYIIKFEANSEFIPELERKMRLDQNIIKFITMRLED